MEQDNQKSKKIQHYRGLEKDLPILEEARLALTTDTKKAFIGSDEGNIELAKKKDLDDRGVSVKDFGAKGDGVTDDTIAIQRALNHFNNTFSDNERYTGDNKLKGRLIFPEGSRFVVTDTITAFGNYDIEILGTIIYKGVANKTCFKIGNDTLNMSNCKLILNASTSVANVIAFELVNLLSCDIQVRRISGFFEALRCVAKNSLGWCGNKVNINILSYNVHDIHLTSFNSGWTNANHFVGGFFYKRNNAGVEQTCIKISSLDNTFYAIDTNLFEGHNFEEGKPTTIPMKFEVGIYNRVQDIRVENCSDTIMAYIDGEGNTIDTRGIYSSSDKIVTSANQNGFVGKPSDMIKVYDSGFLGDNTVKYNDNPTMLYNSNFGFIYRYSDNPPTSLSPSGTYGVTESGLAMLDSSGIIAHRFKVNDSKFFRFVATLADDIMLLNTGIRCFDANMNLLALEDESIATETWKTNSYIKTGRLSRFYQNPNVPFAVTGGSGAYYSPIATLRDFVFEVHPSVKFVELYTLYGFGDTDEENDAVYQKFEMYTDDGSAIAINPAVDKDEYIVLGKSVYDKSNFDEQITGHINVKSYGAKGDGVTDDTVAIQNILDNYDNIYFPEGYYLINDTLTFDGGQYVDKVGITTRYVGKSITFDRAKIIINSDFDGFILKGSGTTIDGMILDTTMAGDYNSSAFIMEAIGGYEACCEGNLINNLKIRQPYGNWQGTGLKLLTGGESYIYRNKFTNLDIEGFYYGIRFDNNSYNGINANAFSGSIWSSKQSMRIDGSGNIFDFNTQNTVADANNPELANVYVKGTHNNFIGLIFDVGENNLVKYAYEFDELGYDNTILTYYPEGLLKNPHNNRNHIQRITTPYDEQLVMNNVSDGNVFYDYRDEDGAMIPSKEFKMISGLNNSLGRAYEVIESIEVSSENMTLSGLGTEILENPMSLIKLFTPNKLSTSWNDNLQVLATDTALPSKLEIVMNFKEPNDAFMIRHLGLTFGMTSGVVTTGENMTVSVSGKTKNDNIVPFSYFSGEKETYHTNRQLLFVEGFTGAYHHNQLKSLTITIDFKASVFGYYIPITNIYANANDLYGNSGSFAYIGGDTFGGDIKFADDAGLVLKTPNGSDYKLEVKDNGGIQWKNRANGSIISLSSSSSSSSAVSVKDFGAIGDGVADDTVAIQSAIDLVGNNGGGTVYIPSGTYRHSSAINLNKSSVNLTGEGHSSLLINYSDDSSIKIGNTTNGAYACSVKNMYIMGTSLNTNSHGIEYIYESADSVVENVVISDFGGHGIYGGHTGHVNNIVITRCYINSNKGDGIRFQYDVGQINAIWINHNNIVVNDNGITFFGNNVVIENNTIQANRRYAIALSDSTPSTPKYCFGSTIRKNYTEQSGSSVTENASIIGIFTGFDASSPESNRLIRNLSIEDNYFGESGSKYTSIIYIEDIKSASYPSNRACVITTKTNYASLPILSYNRPEVLSDGCIIDENLDALLPSEMINSLPPQVEVRGTIASKTHLSKQLDELRTEITTPNYGGRFEWRFNPNTNSLDLVVLD